MDTMNPDFDRDTDEDEEGNQSDSDDIRIDAGGDGDVEETEAVYDVSMEDLTDADSLIRDSIATLSKASSKKSISPKPEEAESSESHPEMGTATVGAVDSALETEEQVVVSKSDESGADRLKQMSKSRMARLLKEAHKRIKDQEAEIKQVRLAWRQTQNELALQIERERNLLERNKELTEKAKKLDESLTKIEELNLEFRKYQSRMERDRELLIKTANRELIKRLLSVLDSFDSADKFVFDGYEHSDQIKVGITRIQKQLFDILQFNGLQLLEAKGKQFDPKFHEAMLIRESSEAPDKCVLDELRKGYLFFDQLLRPTLVAVAKNPNTLTPEPPDLEISLNRGLPPAGGMIEVTTLGDQSANQEEITSRSDEQQDLTSGSDPKKDTVGEVSAPAEITNSNPVVDEVSVRLDTDAEDSKNPSEGDIIHLENNQSSGDQPQPNAPHTDEFDRGKNNLS